MRFTRIQRRNAQAAEGDLDIDEHAAVREQMDSVRPVGGRDVVPTATASLGPATQANAQLSEATLSGLVVNQTELSWADITPRPCPDRSEGERPPVNARPCVSEPRPTGNSCRHELMNPRHGFDLTHAMRKLIQLNPAFPGVIRCHT